MKTRVAEILLNIGAVEIRPNDHFTWASGIQSPVYCDNRKIIGDVNARREIIDSFKTNVEARYEDVDIIAGTSTAGIPHAAYLSEVLNLPMCYVRGSKKKHGRGNQIEGAEVKGKRVVLIEDLISTGGSSLEAVEALKDNGANVLGVEAIFTYNLVKSIDAFKQADVSLHTLSNIDTLLDVLVENNEITSNERDEVTQFLNAL